VDFLNYSQLGDITWSEREITAVTKAVLGYAGAHEHLELRGLFSKPKTGE
jgi:hypothetical protein